MDGRVVDETCGAARPPDSLFSSIARLKHPKGISRPSTEGNPWKGSSLRGSSQEPVIRSHSPVGAGLESHLCQGSHWEPPTAQKPWFVTAHGQTKQLVNGPGATAQFLLLARQLS